MTALPARPIGRPDDGSALDPYDAVLLLSFGGPEAPDDVMPFLRDVTAGRGVPDERLADVAEHYHHFGGRSPINDQNRALLAALTDELRRRGIDVAVVWGNRNWAPYVTDVLREAHDRGARRVVTILTSAYSSYSCCRQYREDLAAALLALADEGVGPTWTSGRPRAPVLQPPGVRRADGLLDRGTRWRPCRPAPHWRSSPTPSRRRWTPSRARTGAPTPPSTATWPQVIAAAVGEQDGAPGAVVELVYCSRSGHRTQPWLEPDVGDHLRGAGRPGRPGVAVVPIGFVSDHMEVVYDLDTEAREIAEQVGLPFARAATVGTDPAFVRRPGRPAARARRAGAWRGAGASGGR